MCQSNVTDCSWISHRDGLCLFLTHCTEVEVGNSPEFTSAMVNCGNAQHSEFEVLLSLHTNREYIVCRIRISVTTVLELERFRLMKCTFLPMTSFCDFICLYNFELFSHFSNFSKIVDSGWIS